MSRWPPIIWPAMAFASVLILMGLGGGQTWALISGVAIEVMVLAASAYLAFVKWGDRPRPSWAKVLLGCLVVFYVVAGAAAAINGEEYLGIVLLAAMIPTSAVLLLMATVRAKTGHGEGDLAAEPGDDPHPGIGVDDETPVGDTREHSDAAEGRPVPSRPSTS
jgi:hypothetical protein